MCVAHGQLGCIDQQPGKSNTPTDSDSTVILDYHCKIVTLNETTKQGVCVRATYIVH